MCVFSSLGLIPLTLFSICGFTDMASNTAVTQSTLTDSMMLTHATCACSFAFRLSVATPPKAAVRRLSQDWPLRCSSGFSSSMAGLGWSCLHYGFTQFIFNAGGAILERMVRIPGRSTQASSSSQNLTSILQWMEEDAFDGHCIHPPGGTEHRVIRRADETAS